LGSGNECISADINGQQLYNKLMINNKLKTIMDVGGGGYE
jgi:hypothetical protein